MKKLMKSLMLFAAAAMALTSCQNEEMDSVQENEAYTMNFVAGAPESRTSVEVDGTTATFSWAESGETFTFVQHTTAGLKKGTNVTFANNAGLAEITATFTEAGSPIVAIYPEDAWVDNTDDFNKAKLIVAKDQNILDGTFDPNADLLVSKVVEPENATDTHSLQFGRVVAIGKMALKNLPVVGSEVINKVNFSIDSENALTGRLYIDLETAEVSEWGYYNNAYKEVNLKDGNMAVAATNDIYFTCMPATVAAGETFTVVVTTNVATYTHSVTIPEGKSIQFSAGRVSSFGVNMAEAERVVNSGLSLPWSESFDSEDLSKYDIVNGGSDTKVYPADKLAGGEAGEILIGKGGGSLTATFASDGTAKTLNLWFKSNKDFIEVSSATEGVTITKLTSTGYTVALAEGVQMFKLTLTNNDSSNARVDDIVLTTEAPAVASLAIANQTTSFTAGNEFVFDGTVSAVYENGVIEEVTGYTVDRSDVDMTTAGEYTVTITYNGVSATYTINVAKAGVETETFELSVTGTYANSVITWVENGVTIVQAKGNGTTAVNSSYNTASTMRLYQGHVLNFSSDNNIIKIEMVAKGTNYGKTATVNVGTLNNPQTSGCTLTWTGSAKEVIITNGSGSGGSQLQTSKITITYEVSGDQGGTDTPEAAVQTLSFSQTTASATVGQDFTEPTLSGAMTTVTYTSSNEAVATVDANTGAVTLVGAGETTITATAEETTEYKSATASYTLTVTAASNSVTITLDCTSQPFTTNLPTSKDTYKEATYTDKAGYQWILCGTSATGYYYNSSKYLMIGKSGSYIGLPVVEGKKLTSVSLYCNAGASTNVKYEICDTSNKEVDGGADKNGVGNKTTPLVWNLTNTSVDTQYRIRITTAYNGQITKIVLNYE